MVRIEYAGTTNSVEKWMSKGTGSYFMFVVSGRSKGNQVSGSKFSVPCVGTTEGTNLLPGRWVERLVNLMKTAGTRSGRLFQRKLNPPRMCEWEGDFMTLLELVQAMTELIEKKVEVRDSYGISQTI
jgi:hypothetical protein